MITILTPTYNRGYIINQAYKSLINQTNKDFEWLIIDDGSSDNTKEIVEEFIKERKIKIRYYYKENGGKHTAVNYGIKKSKGKYTLILDSDDYLTDDAVETIKKYWKKYENKNKICALSFLRITPDGKKIGKEFSEKEIISNNISFRYNKNIYGDMAEVYKTDILLGYPFPVYGKERFLSEAIIWNKIALKYDTVYIRKGIYKCEYLDDGLSKGFLKAVYKNPIGALENANLFLINKFRLKIRIKNAILYDGYSLIAKRKITEIIRKSNNKFLSIVLLPLGILFSILLKLKFK